MRRKLRVNILCLLGVLLTIAGVAGMLDGPNVSQYAALPPEGDLLGPLEKMETAWEDTSRPVSVHETTGGISLTAGAKSQDDVNLYQVGGNFFQVYPRTFVSGRPLSRGDSGKNVIVLDERLAFLLFGDQEAEGKTVRIGEAVYTVAGVAAHRRRIGEKSEYTAWIPVNTGNAPKAEIAILTLGGRSADAERTLFEASCADALGSGQAFDLTRERIRGCIILLFALAGWCLFQMARGVRALKKVCRTWYDRTREDLKAHYPRQILGRMLARCLGAALLWGMLIGAYALLVMGAARLMMVFPEWVPEELVSASAIARRFWDLTGMAASPVQFRTPELAEIRFWSGLIRWGVAAFLLGAWLGGKRTADRRKAEVQRTEKAPETDAQES